MFIVLEGIDGCGKSTQAKRLHEWLVGSGHDVFLTAEPSKSTIGSCLREILSGDEEIDPRALALLFTSDRYEHIKKEIEPALNAGKIVICERYYYSTVAYQAAQGVDRNWLMQVNSFAVDFKPDLAFFLDVGPEVAIPKIKEKDAAFRELLDNAHRRVEELRRHYLNNRKAIFGKVNQKKAADELIDLKKKLDLAEEDYEREKSKYLKFEKFEKPTTLASDKNKYDLFLEKVRREYDSFEGLIRVKGTNSEDFVFGELKRNIKEKL